ncbi:hypothetical protein DXD72_01905 [Bifidobacterium bifidum]|jgi:hypothetical protein|uniref:Uncharacterized protein n=3 Tax=Bifidobacterium bifidum TaxID=1681 RepID=I3WGC0_BIFBI|nr:hypothetical protein BBB_0337 [Bifidobacterium bifidum BGN4]ERI82262.1 hypothetical protein BIFBIF_02035 [Bifidobacterium bifidum ATCC 29521 = JCM 1255 = DSM 20456]KAB5603237.1 hypothetical protein GBA75_02165 [Bifidobacterium bifidum]OKY89989.1 MAG: hypothetical protein BHV59_01080 [Bifidobacterium sp. 56_9_plus]GDZ12160.1 hypothetical protein MCC02030_04730 [Bifidobacteriaceae bacterium MCC02030]GDZ23769.1 hypothetical protein MCC01958_02550 [Bifidobacteriaceae bacterium MCC01958]GJM4656
MYAAIRYAVYVLFDVSASSALFRVMVDGVAVSGTVSVSVSALTVMVPKAMPPKAAATAATPAMSFLNCIGTFLLLHRLFESPA